MGGAASSLLDEGKCTYIRGTRAVGGLPGSAAPAGGPAQLRRPWPPRARAERVSAPPSTCGAQPAGAGTSGARGRLARPAFSCGPGLGRGCAWAGAQRAGDALGSAAARLREAGAGRGVGDATSFSPLSPPGGLFRPGPETPCSPLSSELFLKRAAGISLVYGDFPGDSRPIKQNFPPGNVGLVL